MPNDKIPISPSKIGRMTDSEIKSFTIHEYYLSDIYVYAINKKVKYNAPCIQIPGYGGVSYMRIWDGPYYRNILENGIGIYKTLSDSLVKGYDENRLVYINGTIEKNHGYKVLGDGHHRVSILLYLHGNIKIKVGRIMKGI